MVSTAPKQLLPTSEKLFIADGHIVPRWIKENGDYYSSMKQGQDAIRTEIDTLIREAEGVFNIAPYNYVTDPHKQKDKTLGNLPARIRNYDIITPIEERFMGERRERPFEFPVSVINPDIINLKKIEKQKAFKQLFAQMFVNHLNEAGVNTNVDSKEVPELQEFEKDFENNWSDARANYGQDAINYIMQDQNLMNQYMKGYHYWLTCGRVFTQKSVENDEVVVRFLVPSRVTVLGWDENSKLAEDAEAVIVTHRWTISAVLDRFRNTLTDDHLAHIITYQQKTNDDTAYTHQMHTEEFERSVTIGTTNFMYMKDNSVDVEQISWKTYTHRGILTYTTPLNTIATKEVDDSYVLDKKSGDISIDWKIETEWWEIWKIADQKLLNEKNYLSWGVGEVQRTKVNNTNKCKLPINGTYFGYNPYVVDSIRKRGKIYNEIYNIMHYRFELTLARNKDKLLMFPLGLIPTKKGWSTEKWMHSINAFSTVFFDETSERAQMAIQAMKEIDMSLYQYMKQMWEVMRELKDEWWDVCGMNRQRYGQANSSDGKGTNQQAIYQSSVSTKELVAQYEYFTETDANGIVDYSKYAYVDGKSGVYTMPDGRKEYFDINGREHLEMNYGVHVQSSVEAHNKLEFARNTVLQPLVQNGLKGSDAIAFIEASNISRLRKLLNQQEAIQAEAEQRKMEADQQLKATEAEMLKNIQAAKDDTIRYVAELKAKVDIEKELILADSFNAKEGDTDNNGIDQSQDIADRSAKRTMELRKQIETERANRAKEQHAANKLEVDKLKAKSSNKN